MYVTKSTKVATLENLYRGKTSQIVRNTHQILALYNITRGTEMTTETKVCIPPSTENGVSHKRIPISVFC